MSDFVLINSMILLLNWGLWAAMTIAFLNVAEFDELLLKAGGMQPQVCFAGPDQLASQEPRSSNSGTERQPG